MYVVSQWIKLTLTRSSSRDETANVNVLRWHRARTTKYKTLQRSGSLQKFYHGKKIRQEVEFENKVCSYATAYICITHSFSVTTANVAINNISLKTRLFGLHFRSRKCWCIFNHFYVMHLKATEFGEIGAQRMVMALRHYYAVQGHSRSPILVPIKSSYKTSY